MTIKRNRKPSRAKTLAFLCALGTVVVLGGTALYAGALEAPVKLLIEATETPRMDVPLSLNLTVESQVKARGIFQIRIAVPPGVETAAAQQNLSGALDGGQRAVLPLTLTPKGPGDFRVAFRLQFQADGASSSFTVENAALLRVRADKTRSEVFVDQATWTRKHLAERIKEAKAAWNSLPSNERDRALNLLQGLPADRSAAEYRVPDRVLDRQQSFLQTAHTMSAAGGFVSETDRARLKESLIGSNYVAVLGSAERFTDTAGLVRRNVPVSFIYRKELLLNAGELYTLETRNLTPGSDSVLYLFAYDASTGQLTPVAQNDDAGDESFASRIQYVPERDGSYFLVVRSYNYETRGAGDIFMNDAFVERTPFAGVAFQIDSDAGDTLNTVALKRTPGRTDTVMFVRSEADNAVLWDDDGGMELGSKLVLPDLRRAEMVLGAYAPVSEGQCDLILNTADGTFGSHPRGDLDGDGLSNELERALGTDPTSEDSDGDGLLDSWEVLGVRNTDLPSLGADPNGADIFVQIDWMAAGHNHEPRPESIQINIDSFAAEGLNLHVDAGDEAEGGQGHLLPAPWTHLDNLALGSATYLQIKAANFDSAKRGGLYHYAIFAHKQGATNCSSGVANINGKDLLVTLGCTFGQIGTISDQAGTFMHELGHNLGLRHGGFQDLNYKPNYRSVMNYLFQLTGTCGTLGFINGVTYTPCTPREFFYSHGLGIDLDENCLDESVGIGEGPIDWNGDGQIDTCVRADINRPRGAAGDRRFDLLRDYDDYSNLRLPFAGFVTEMPVEEELVVCAPPLPHQQ